MKVKYINRDEELWLVFWWLYKVFWVVFYIKKGDLVYYIKWNSKYIYPFSYKNFSLVNSEIDAFWSFWFDTSWDMFLWPKKIFKDPQILRNYYEDVEYYTNLVNVLLNKK